VGFAGRLLRCVRVLVERDAVADGRAALVAAARVAVLREDARAAVLRGVEDVPEAARLVARFAPEDVLRDAVMGCGTTSARRSFARL
jgi:hypothetical protein